MRKKYGLIKVLAILLLLVVVVTYFVDGRGGNKEYLAIFDLFFNYMQSFYYFFDTALVILAIGGFYGLLNRIPAYRKLIENIVGKIGKKKSVFVIVVTVLFAIISSLTGLNLVLMLFVPFVISIILLLGYDKLVALSATVGGILVGFIGGILVTVKDSSSQYEVSYTTLEKIVGLKKSWTLSTTLPKCLLLIVGIVLLVLYIINHIKSVGEKSAKYALSTSDPLLVETKERTLKTAVKRKTKRDGKVRVWPLIVVLCVVFVLLVLGYMPWNSLFGVKCFDEFHEWLTGLTIGKYAVFTSLFSSTINAFGRWNDSGSYMMTIFLMFMSGIILILVYRIKIDDALDGVLYGIKKMLLPAMIAILAYSVLVCTYNNGFIETIVTNASKSFGDNMVVHALITLFGSILNVDLYYSVAGVFSTIVSSLTDKANLSVFAVMFQSVYGIVQFVGPTSLLLIVGLSYLEVPYKTWLKYIWRFVVELLIAIFVILMIVSLL